MPQKAQKIIYAPERWPSLLICSGPRIMHFSMIRPWEEIHSFYATLGDTEASRAMAQLVREIESSRYKDGLFAWTSAFDLCIVQTPVTYPYGGPYLKISSVKDGLLEFRYIDTPIEAKQWRRVVAGADGFARLERFLEQLHWF